MAQTRVNKKKLKFNVLVDLKDFSAQEALSAHHKFKSKSSAPLALGDGYLYAHVTAFRNVRDIFLALGGSFSKEDKINYRTFPFAALPAILKNWEIPYFENAKALQAIETEYPGVLQLYELLNPSTAIQKNYLLHEASHCIFDRLVPKNKTVKGLSLERSQILRALMGEAYANTTAALCAGDIERPVDLALFALNDYGYCLDPIRGDLINRAVKKFGYVHTFKLLYFGHIILKFLASSITKRELLKMMPQFIPDLRIPKADEEWLVALINSMLTGHDFIIDLNSFYFKLMGIKTSLNKVLRFDFIQAIVTDDVLFPALDTLADLTVHGLKGKALEPLKVMRP